MLESVSISRARFFKALAWAGVVCLGCSTSQAGEKIQFSDRSTKADLPVKGPEDLKSSSLQNFINSRRSELGAPDVFSLPPARPSAGSRDKREQERIEERKNWIMQNAESLRGDKSRKDAKDDSADEEPGHERKPLTLMERFTEDRERKSQASTNQFNSGFRPDVRSLDFSSRSGGATNRTELGRDARTNAADGPGQPGEVRSSARLSSSTRNGEAELPRSNGDGSAGLSLLERTERLRQQDERSADLRRLIDTPGAVSVAPKRGVDLLNTPDVTRQEINPTTGRGLDEISSRLDLKRGFDSPGGGSRPNILNELSPGGNGRPAGGQILLLPTEPLRMERRPAVLEIPKRKI